MGYSVVLVLLSGATRDLFGRNLFGIGFMRIGRRFGNKRQLRALFFALAGAVGVLSLLPQTGPPGGGVDLGLHAVTYIVLGIVGVLAFGNMKTVGIGVFLFSAALETGQAFIPRRSGSIDDLIANGVGIAIGLLVVLIFRRVRLAMNVPLS